MPKVPNTQCPPQSSWPPLAMNLLGLLSHYPGREERLTKKCLWLNYFNCGDKTSLLKACSANMHTSVGKVCQEWDTRNIHAWNTATSWANSKAACPGATSTSSDDATTAFWPVYFRVRLCECEESSSSLLLIFGGLAIQHRLLSGSNSVNSWISRINEDWQAR